MMPLDDFDGYAPSSYNAGEVSYNHQHGYQFRLSATQDVIYFAGDLECINNIIGGVNYMIVIISLDYADTLESAANVRRWIIEEIEQFVKPDWFQLSEAWWRFVETLDFDGDEAPY